MKLGFLLETISGSQLSFYLTQYANKAINEGHEIVLFHNTPSQLDLPFGGGILQLQETFSFDGVVIATNLNLAAQLIKFPGPNKKFFYVWDLEWIRVPSNYKQFNFFAQIYQYPLLKLIARSKDHAQIINKCWNKEIAGIVEDCNIDEFIKLCH